MNLQTPSLEDRIQALEQQLRSPVGVDQNQYESGLSPGGPYVQRVGNWGWTQGPVVCPVDFSVSFDFRLKVPFWVTRILQCQMNIIPTYLSKLTDTGTGGSNAKTSGGPSATTNVGTNTHRHRWFNFVTSAGPTYTWRQGTSGPAISPNVQIPADTAQDLDTDAPSATVAVGSNTHTHNTDISHDHTIASVLSQVGAASNVHVLIEGADVSVALGGPWNAEAEVEISPYLKNGINPSLGWYDFEIQSDTFGAVLLSFDWYVIGKPVAAP